MILFLYELSIALKRLDMEQGDLGSNPETMKLSG